MSLPVRREVSPATTLKAPLSSLVGADSDLVTSSALFLPRVSFDGESEPLLSEGNKFAGGSADRVPLNLSARSIPPADNIRERVAETDAVQKAEGITDVALAARVGTDNYCKPGRHRSVSSIKFLKSLSWSDVIMVH